VKMNIDSVNGSAASSEAAFTRTIAITITAALVGLAVIGVMGWFFGRSIILPLGSMQRAISRTADELDFTDAIRIRSKDEIGRTLEAYNQLLAKLRTSFSEIQSASARMVTITEEVDRSSREIAPKTPMHRVMRLRAWRRRSKN